MLLLLPAASAFRSPQHQSLVVRATASPIPDTTTALHLNFDSLLLSDAFSNPKGAAVSAAAATVGVPDPTSLFNYNFGETFRNVALGATALIFVFAALTSLAAAILIPAGAEQLETECTALIPDTWTEYLGRLQEGEAMKDRPDLMFELGLLLNKCKAGRLEMLCVEAKLAPELWTKYQNLLADDQELQDRPEFIAALNSEVFDRAVQVLRENTSICPVATWEAFEAKAGESKVKLSDDPIMMEDLARELGYPDLLGACTACLLKDANAEAGEPNMTPEEAIAIATTITGITEIRRNSNQWDEDEE